MRRRVYELAVFSSSACTVRKDLLLEHPYRDLLYAEDRAFVIDYLMAGGAIAYCHTPCVSYRRRMSWKRAFRAAYRAQVSKRLIRELAATYTGCRFSSTRDSVYGLFRALFVVPSLCIRILMALREPRGVRWRAIVFALRSTGGTLGLAKGVFAWRNYVDTLSHDDELIQSAKEHCHRLE